AIHFVNEAYKHCKAICSTGDTAAFLDRTFVGNSDGDNFVISGNRPNDVASDFIIAIAKHRNWEREMERKVPA
ncbi:MAG: hypothetical protein ABIU09_09910, partial [Pyrinomonadaceae bacterium]